MTQLKTWHVFYNAIVTLNMVVGITQSDLLAQFGLEGWVGMMGKSGGGELMWYCVSFISGSGLITLLSFKKWMLETLICIII